MVSAMRPRPPSAAWERPLSDLPAAKKEASRARRKRALEADRALVAGAWARAAAWCEARGLAEFYREADRRGVRFERAHADDQDADWDRFQLGGAKGRGAPYPPVATLSVGDTEFRLQRRTDRSPLNLYAAGVLVHSWAFHARPHGRPARPATVDRGAKLPPAAERLFALAPAHVVGALMHRMSVPAYGGVHNVPFYLPAARMALE